MDVVAADVECVAAHAVEFVVVAVVDALLHAVVGPAASPDPGCAA